MTIQIGDLIQYQYRISGGAELRKSFAQVVKLGPDIVYIEGLTFRMPQTIWLCDVVKIWGERK